MGGESVHSAESGLKVLVFDEFEATVIGFADGGEAFDPVAGIEIVDAIDHLVGWSVDMAADDAHTIPLCGKITQGIFITAHGVDGVFNLGLDGTADGVVFLAPELAGPVVKPVDHEEHGIAETPQQGKPSEIGGDGIKGIAMHADIIAVRSLVDVFVAKMDAVELKRKDFPEEVVMIAPQVDDFRAVLFRFFQNDPDEAGVFRTPLAPFFQVPSIDNVPIHDEFFALDVAEEVIDLVYFAVCKAKVNVGDDNGPVSDFLAFHAEIGKGRSGEAAGTGAGTG
jgi:hypothetical protein